MWLIAKDICWYQCTVKGGREGSELDAATLARACEELGAGEILLNCIDKAGTNSGFDLELIKMVKEAVTIPVIASSGAGKPEHFSEVFTATGADAALAPGTLPPGAHLSFTFGDDFPLPGFSGQAEIRWQRHVNQEGICQYGLGFLDQKSGWAMRELLLCN